MSEEGVKSTPVVRGPMITVTLYSRKDCHLCEQARADLESLKAEILINWWSWKSIAIQNYCVSLGPTCLSYPLDHSV